MLGDEEGCVATDRGCVVNFVTDNIAKHVIYWRVMVSEGSR